MAGDKRKKGFSISFELSPSGLLGVAVVCFCIFLWMFLLGIWSGQTVLNPGGHGTTGQGETVTKTAKSPPKAPEGPEVKAVPSPAAAKKEAGKVGETEKQPAPMEAAQPEVSGEEEDPSFFAVQVGAFKDRKLADKAVASWQQKGYKVFSRTPEGPDDPFTRVYIGQFDSMTAAKEQVAALRTREKIEPFIVLIPAD